MTPDIRELLLLGDKARIQSMQRDRWIDYARASAVLDRELARAASIGRIREPIRTIRTI